MDTLDRMIASPKGRASLAASTTENAQRVLAVKRTGQNVGTADVLAVMDRIIAALDGTEPPTFDKPAFLALRDELAS